MSSKAARNDSRLPTLAAAGSMFATIFALRLLITTDADAILVLCVVPIALCAIEFGLAGGAAAAVFACVSVGVLELLGVVSISGIGYVSRLTPFIVVGVLVGRFADSLRGLTNRVTSAEELSQDLIATIGTDGRFQRVNPAWQSTLGYAPEDLLGQPFIDLVHPDDAERTMEEATRIAAGGESAGFRNRYRAMDGSYRWLEWNARGTSDDGVIYCTARDITARQQAEEQTAAARAEAERANLAKSEFLSRMSHEFRTPLNAILGFSQLLQMADLTEQQQENVRQILGGGRHLLSLIDEILDISRIETGSMTLSLEPVDVTGAITDALSLVRPLAAEREITVEADLPPQWEIHARADTQRLRQVLLNLLSNAVKYNRENGRIRVSCEVIRAEAEIVQQRVRITVADTGRGIAEADIERLFTPFDRLGAEYSDVQGTGLGLALSRGLVERMHGILTVTSVLGEGSTFTIELQRAEAPAAPGYAGADLHEGAGRSLPGGYTLLYIEDNVANLRLVEQILTHQPQVRLIPAMHARLGLQLAEQHEPDLILLDLHLPDVSGAEALELLKTNPRTREIPVVILTADATPGQVTRLREAGANNYLTKPLDVRRFLDVVEEQLLGR